MPLINQYSLVGAVRIYYIDINIIKKMNKNLLICYVFIINLEKLNKICKKWILSKRFLNSNKRMKKKKDAKKINW